VYRKEQDDKSMGKLTSLLKPVLEDFEQLDEEDKFKLRFNIRAFNRFYAYMAQIARTFDRELFKTYIFCEFLFRLLPKTPHEKVDLENKLSLEHHIFKVQPSGSIELKPTKEEKTLKGEKGGTGSKMDEKRDLLDNIIDKINIMYKGDFTEADRVIIETIYDKFKAQNKTLKKQAKNSDVNMFAKNIFPQAFSKVAQACYVEQMDAFAKLFEEPSFYQKVMEEMGKAMYYNFKNGEQ
jgi:type I restriction enzyme R subunit